LEELTLQIIHGNQGGLDHQTSLDGLSIFDDVEMMPLRSANLSNDSLISSQQQAVTSRLLTRTISLNQDLYKLSLSK
jgi:hypothetical protein